ncbi:MAG: hypothetical protein ACK4WJ_01760 [Endomicrobiia bacterium]
MQKILIISSKDEPQSFLPQKLISEFQIKIVSNDSSIKQLINEIIQFKPQLIIVNEFISLKYLEKICKIYNFVPVCCIGKIEEEKKLEKFLELGIVVIKIPVYEEEIISTIKNILWFSLAKEELWLEEYELARYEKKKDRIFAFLKYSLVFFVLFFLFFVSSKVYNYILRPKELFSLVEFKYIKPSDITVIEDKYIINDWTLRNIFEYLQSNDNMVGMLVAEQQFNNIAFDNKNQILFASSAFDNKVYLYKYPDVNVIISSFTINNGVILSLCIGNEKNLYILNNEKILYEFKMENLHKLVFISSFSIQDCFPIDINIFEDKFYFLDNNNNIWVMKKNYNKFEIEKVIVLSLYFAGSIEQFNSFSIGEKFLYLLNEKENKLYKLPKEIL